MAKDSLSPFSPGQLVPLDYFVGRRPEIQRLMTRVRAAGEGRLATAFLSGERGIGKSSLAAFIRYLAERDHQLLGLHVYLGGVETLEELGKAVFDRLLKLTHPTSLWKKVSGLFGRYVEGADLFGVKINFNPPRADLSALVRNFATAIRSIVDQIKDDWRGLLLILDDINGLASSTAFANWFKSFVDEVASDRQPLPLCIVVVGLEERRRSLIELQPSIARVFDLIDVRAWSDDETKQFFVESFSKVKIQVEPQALDLLTLYSGGLPMLAHEIGDAAFRRDEHGRITRANAWQAILEAAEIVGRKHLQPNVFEAIRSDRYRQMLRKLAAHPVGSEFRRADVRASLSPEESSAFDGFVRRMIDLSVLSRHPDRGAGAYRFTNLLHYLYFKIEAAKAENALKH